MKYNEKEQFKNNQIKICAPDSLKYAINDVIDVLNKNINSVFNFFNVPNDFLYQINMFDSTEKFRQFIIYDCRHGIDNLPKYAKGTYDNMMCNMVFDIFKDTTGYYRIINNNKEYIDKDKYYRKVKTVLHELSHILYLKYILNNDLSKRIIWLDEGLAQYLSNEYSNTDFLDIFKEVISSTKEKSFLNSLKHGESFYNNKYNGYYISYICVNYLFEINNNDQKSVYNIISNYDKSIDLGNHIFDEAIDYYCKKYKIKL